MSIFYWPVFGNIIDFIDLTIIGIALAILEYVIKLSFLITFDISFLSPAIF